MKNLYKKYSWLILVLLAVVLLGFQKMKINQLRSENQLKNVELSTLKDSVHTFVTKSGELLAKVEAVEVEKSNLKDALELAGIDKQQLKNENIKLKNINLVLQAKMEATGTISTTIIDTFKIEKTDTVYYSKIDDWTDNRLFLYGGTISDNQLNFSKYTFQTGFKFLLTTEKNKSIVTVAFNDNQDGAIKLTTANSIVVPHKTKWYEKPWLWGAAGLAAGIVIAK